MTETGSNRWLRWVTPASCLVTTALFAFLAWHRRWLAEDGLIVLRTARQVLAGNGPVFNVIERVETNTSAVWTLLVTLAGLGGAEDLAPITIALGGALSVAGFALGLDACRRLNLDAPVLLPLGALVPLALRPAWDFATSGLETGVGTLWLSACWWFLVRLVDAPRWRLIAAFVIGLGPLVRPDFAVVAAAFGVAMLVLLRPTVKQAVQLAAAALTVPVAYEIFRLGYYGVVAPLPVLAKSAGAMLWARGWGYLLDFALPYRLWLPLTAVVVLAIVRRPRALELRVVLLATPVLAGLAHLGGVVAMGGDFMHGRMCLPGLWLVLLPWLLVPVRRLESAAVVLVAVWALFTGITVTTHPRSTTTWDEREGSVEWAGKWYPVTSDDMVNTSPAVPKLRKALETGERLLVAQGGRTMPLADSVPSRVVFLVGRLGLGGAATPLQDFVADINGLANPLGAHITVTRGGTPGHERLLPFGWVVAEFGDPSADATSPLSIPPESTAAARHAVTCGELAELRESVRAPLTPERFWLNIRGAWRRSRIVIPSDPVLAEQKFCAQP